MRGRYFIDTNVFVYEVDASSEGKSKIAKRLIEDALEEGNACISTQVMREFINVTGFKIKNKLSLQETERYVETVLEPLLVAIPPAQHCLHAMALAKRYQLSFYDAMIVAAAELMQCDTIYSEDMQHGMKMGRVTIQNPFVKK
jgi:predicted nucleic acid-binding protein